MSLTHLAASASRRGSATINHPLNLDTPNTNSSTSSLRKHRKRPSTGDTPIDTPEPSRKRPKSSHPADDLLKTTFSVTPHPPKVHVKPRTLQPLMLIRREHFLLSHLDLASPTGEFPASRFVRSHIKALDLETRLGSSPVALIAVSQTTRKVYAFERHEDGIYVVCKLGSWVDLDSLGLVSTACCRETLKLFTTRPALRSEPFVVPLTTPQLYREQKDRERAIQELKGTLKKTSRKQSLAPSEDRPSSRHERPGNRGLGAIQKEPPSETQPALTEDTSLPPVFPDHDTSRPTEDPPPVPAAPESILIPEPVTQVTATEIFDNIRTQYTKALYHSKGSVAYFAKGPLSRARAAFHLDLDFNLNLEELVDFLKGLLMTTVLIDKKYRDTIPALVSSMKSQVDTSDDEKAKKKKRRGKRVKLGKDGLYSNEAEPIQKWWRSISDTRESQLAEDETITSEEVRFHIDSLRTRETLLQVILILEVMALEPLMAHNHKDSQLPDLPGEDSKDDVVAAKPTPKKRNKHNLPVLLDVQADRLCIWQSTAMEVPSLMGDSQFSGLGQETRHPNGAGPDPLREFCIDVIVQFFAARLPQQSDALSRKLGGPPIIATPAKPKAKPKSSASKGFAKPAAKPTPKPGSSTRRTAAAKGTNSLEKALSRDRAKRSMSRGPGDALAALRAQTLPAPATLKREGSSDPLSLSSFNSKASPGSLKGKSSNSLGNGKRAGVTMFEDPKARKKAMMQAELKDAISAIKKPNRELAGKVIVEENEKRTSLSMLRKGKKPVRNPHFPSSQQIQVEATPANHRFKDALASAPAPVSKLDLRPPGIYVDDECVPSSSGVVPSSSNSHARRVRRVDVFSSTAKIVAATPLKRSTAATGTGGADGGGGNGGNGAKGGAGLLSLLREEDTIPASSPLVQRNRQTTLLPPAIVETCNDGFAVPSTPVNPRRGKSGFETPLRRGHAVAGSPGVVAATPMQHRQSHLVVAATSPVVVAATPQRSKVAVAATPPGQPQKSHFTIEATPTEVSATPPQPRPRPRVPAPQAASAALSGAVGVKKATTMSIFQKLGWDDDVDDLL